ncbi:MAG TPA: methyltransferase [Geobacteraceae bacterium]
MKNAETCDELRAFDLRISQPRDGYRFSLDPLLLTDFARPLPPGPLLDLGTGCGIMPLLQARLGASGPLVGVEFQPELADLARRNVQANGLTHRITIIEDDLLALGTHFPANSFSMVLANPPFRRRGTGRVSPRAGRDLARHESTAGLADFLAVAKKMVVPGGRLCFVQLPERLPELLQEAASLRLAPTRLRMVHGDSTALARMVLVELVKGRQAALQVLPPLFVYGADGGYTAEMRRIYGEEG